MTKKIEKQDASNARTFQTGSVLRHFVLFICAWPRTIIALTLAMTVAFACFIPRVVIQLDVDAQIPPGHPMVVVGKRIEKQFGGKFVTLIGIYTKDGSIYSPEVLSSINRIQSKLEALPGIKQDSVLSLLSPRLMDVHGEEDSLIIDPIAPSVPGTPQEMSEFRERVDRNSTITSLLVSKDGKSTAILFDFEDFEKAGGARDFYDHLEAILAPERKADVDIVAAGAPTLMHWLMIYTRRVGLLFGVALAMIGYLHYRAFRTIQGMLVPLVTALLGVIWALGFMGITGAPMDPWNIMTPILILAIGAGHSVQILKRYYEEFESLGAVADPLSDSERNRQAVINATIKVGSVMLTAGTIAALSFASLMTFGLPSIQSFGLCTAFGIVAALVVEMTFIPAVRVLLSAPSRVQTHQEKEVEFFEPWLDKLALVVRQKRERPFLWLFTAVILVSAVGAVQLQAGNSMGAQFFEGNAPVRGFRMADKHLAGTRVLQVLIEGDSPNALEEPRVLSAMSQLTTFIERQPLPVGKVVSLVDVFRQIDAGINNVPIGKAKLPESTAAAAQYMLLYSMSANLSDLSRLTDEDLKTGIITIYLKTDNYKLLSAFTDATQREANKLFEGTHVRATVGGGMTSAIALNETMVSGKVKNLVQISALVIIVTALLLRSLVGGLLVWLPLANSALINMGVMGWLGIPLSMGTAAISAMAVGIGADYAVYFIFRVREELRRHGDLREANAAALVTSGKAIAYVATAVAGGYLCLTLSFFKMHVLLGTLVALTMVTASLSTLLFLPAVILRINPRFLQKVRAEAQSATVPRPLGVQPVEKRPQQT